MGQTYAFSGAEGSETEEAGTAARPGKRYAPVIVTTGRSARRSW
jgi:hypothetical protein